MGRDIYFIRAKPKQPENRRTEGEEEEEEDHRRIASVGLGSGEEEDHRRIASVGLGSGDAWPCYWRPIIIGGYRRIQKMELPEDKKQEMLSTILKCCPASHEKVDNSQMHCGYNHIARTDSFWGFLKRQVIVAEQELFQSKNQLILNEAGLWPIVELCLFHHRAPLTTPTIRRVSEMMELMRDFVPYEAPDLAGTPYGEVDDYYNLADERWIELFDGFKLAAAEDNVMAIIE
jgi:hypothetical protein